MITDRMSWVDELEKIVPSGSLSKGRRYFESGSVEIRKGSAERVEARVRGGGLYSVNIYLEDDAVVASCTCPHYGDVNLCKHIFAAVL